MVLAEVQDGVGGDQVRVDVKTFPFRMLPQLPIQVKAEPAPQTGSFYVCVELAKPLLDLASRR